MEEIKTKVCSRCKRELPLAAFSKSNKSIDKLKGECKGCRHDRYIISTPNMERRKISNKLGYKICNKCGIEKPIEEFNKHTVKSGKVIPTSICKTCSHLYYEKNVKDKGVCLDCGKPIHKKSKRCNECAAKETSKTPEWIKNHKESMKKRFEDQEFVKRNLEMILKLSKDPEWIKRNNDGAKKRVNDPKWYENNLISTTGQGFWYGHPIINTTSREYYKKYYNTPVGRESRHRCGSKRRATKLRICTKDQDSFWRMTPERVIRIIKRQNGICPICKKPLDKHYQKDHIIPLSSELGNTPNIWCFGLVRGNVQITHSGCNAGKQNRWNIIRAIDEVLVTDI
jgi:uncharacterized protein YdaT